VNQEQSLQSVDIWFITCYRRNVQLRISRHK